MENILIKFKSWKVEFKVIVVIFSVFFSICFLCCFLILLLPTENTYTEPVRNSSSSTRIQTKTTLPEQKSLEYFIENETFYYDTARVGEENIVKVTRIVDGDTIEVVKDDQIYKVNLIGIDAPEPKSATEGIQCYSSEATDKITEVLLDRDIYLLSDESQGDVDQYDRLLRFIVLPSGELVNYMMLNEGFAFKYETDIPHKFQKEFTAANRRANNINKGVYGDQCKCANQKGDEVSRSCSECKKAIIELKGWDCSTYTVEVDDSSCTSSCPVAIAPTPPTPSYSCNCSKTCGQMVSCNEAYFQLNSCGCSARDGDNDGVPCESIC